MIYSILYVLLELVRGFMLMVVLGSIWNFNLIAFIVGLLLSLLLHWVHTEIFNSGHPPEKKYETPKVINTHK